MNVTSQNQSLVKNELGHYFISLTIFSLNIEIWSCLLPIPWFVSVPCRRDNLFLLYLCWDLVESVESGTCDIFSFLFDWSAHMERYILFKTPPELDQWFQSYEQWNGSQNNRKQKKSIPFSGRVSQSIHPTSDWSR